jgi:hypothetical protein
MNTLACKIIELRKGLQSRDPAFCGDAELWLVQKVLANLEFVIAQSLYDSRRISDFALGAVKFLADQGSSECDVLMASLNNFIVDI